MKWLTGIVLAALLGTIIVTTIGSVVSDDEDVVSPPAPVTTAASSPVTSGASSPVTSGASTGSTAGSGGATTTSPSVASSTTVVTGFTMTELAQHGSSSSCWLLIGGRVFDVTTYLRSHPGGSRTITPWCGKEATKAFDTEDGRGEHSPAAFRLLEDYVLGPIVG